MIPRMPAGADLTQLGICVNNSLKGEVRGRDISSIPKLKAETGMAIARLNADPKWMAQMAKTCRAFEKRVRWAAANGGKKVGREKANKERFARRKTFRPESSVAMDE